MSIARGNQKCPVFRADVPLDIGKKDKPYHKCRREIKRKGYCWSEIMDLDRTIAAFILPRLKEFKRTLVGHPVDMSLEEWNSILDKMIWSFSEIIDDKNNPLYLKKYDDKLSRRYDDVFKRISDGGVLEVKPESDEVDEPIFDEEYYKLDKEYEERVSEGLNLFGKHFQSLWH